MEKEHFIGLDEYEDHLYEDPDELDKEESLEPTLNQLKLEEALSKLSDREKHILFTYLNNPNKKLSDRTMQELCDIHSTTSENVRQIKTRALKKLEKYCKQ